MPLTVSPKSIFYGNFAYTEYTKKDEARLGNDDNCYVRNFNLTKLESAIHEIFKRTSKGA